MMIKWAISTPLIDRVGDNLLYDTMLMGSCPLRDRCLHWCRRELDTVLKALTLVFLPPESVHRSLLIELLIKYLSTAVMHGCITSLSLVLTALAVVLSVLSSIMIATAPM